MSLSEQKKKTEKALLEQVELKSIKPIQKYDNEKIDSDSNFEQTERIEEREHWPHHMDFILACVGYAVGFGSIWRFPYLCYSNGGGAFLIPFLFFMIIFGVPLFYMELAIAQFSGSSPLALWEICPLFKGVGWGMIIISGLVCVYYNIILTWVVYYLGVSFTTQLPWSTCSNEWNTCSCVETKILDELRKNLNVSDLFPFKNNSRESLTQSSNTFLNCSSVWLNKTTLKTASEEYWRHNTLEMTDDATTLGSVRWQLLICLAIAWVFIFLCLCKGVKSVGKVVYVTATSPYLFLLILLIRNCMLPGAWLGIKFYITPVWSKLLDFKIWHAAALQVFFALGPAWGGLITMGSFNKFHNNCYRDALIVPVINFLTSIFGGFVIFAVIGFMAHTTGKPVSEVVDKGPGLVFVAYPEAIAQMPGAPVWAVLFFLMLITIGLDSQFGMFETMTSSFIVEFPKQLGDHKVKFVAFMCFLEFLVGVPLITQGGIYIFTIMDSFIGSFALCVIALSEVIVICYIYGINRFCREIEMMIGFQPSMFWKVTWCAITPVALLVVLVSLANEFKYPDYIDSRGNTVWPTWLAIFGWLTGCLSIVAIPVVAIYRIIVCEHGGSIIERIKFLSKPSSRWGPQVDIETKVENFVSSKNEH